MAALSEVVYFSLCKVLSIMGPLSNGMIGMLSLRGPMFVRAKIALVHVVRVIPILKSTTFAI